MYPSAADPSDMVATKISIPVNLETEEMTTPNKFSNLKYITPPVIVSIDSAKNNQGNVIIKAEQTKDIDDNDFDNSSSEEEDEDDERVSEVHSQAGIFRVGGSVSSTHSTSTIPPEKRGGHPFLRKYRGIFLAIASSLIFSVSALLVKKMENYDPFNSALYKFQGALIPAIPLLLQKRFCSKKGAKVVENVWPLTYPKKAKTFGLVLLRSFLTCNALILHFYSLKYLPVSEALVISSASPLFVSIFAKIFLGEKCGYATIVASIFSLVGVVAIAKPPILSGSESFNSGIMIGSGLGFASTVISSISYIVLRYIRKVHYSVTTLMYGAWGSLENLMIVLLIPGLIIPSSLKEWGLIGALAALTLFGQLAIILAMKTEQAGPVALVRTFDVLFAFLLEIAVWGTLPDLWSLLGASIIVLSVVFIGLRKWVRSLPKGHPTRQRLRFISM